MDSTQAAIRKLTAEEARRAVDLGDLQFTTTADLYAQPTLVGQERAAQALQLGLSMPQQGYNIFVSGLTGLEARQQIADILTQHATDLPTPGDWVYVHNFRRPDQPQDIELDAGQGRRLQEDMHNLITHLRETLPQSFRQEAFESEQRELSDKYEREARRIQEAFASQAREKGFTVQPDQRGNIMFIPIKESGEPMSQEEIEHLSDSERRTLEQRQSELMYEFRDTVLQQRQLMQQMSEDIRGIERQFGAALIAPLINELKQRYPQEAVQHYLDAVQVHLISHLDRFKEGGQPQPGFMLPMMPQADTSDPFLEYRVNVIVDNSETQGAPVIVEGTPNYKNLFGTIDRAVDPHGRVVTNFTRIQAGSLLRANGGYILFSLEDALTEPFVWKTLKRTLQSNQVKIEVYDPFAMFTISALQPEPIPINTKVVVLGSPWLYYMLYFYDPDFSYLFKIKADFGEEMDRTAAHQASYAYFIAELCRQEQLCQFDRSGVEAIVEEGMRRVSDQDKLASQFGMLKDLVREACYAARQADGTVVSRAHVEQARQARTFRSNRIEEKMREFITEGTILLDTDGSRVGQINGLSVLHMGDYVFGRPARVTATTSMGRSGIVNIEREAKLSGSTHDKGILILSGYLRQQYAQDKPLTLSASLCFEQSYSGIDGDSASSTELYALLSRLAGLPIRQDLAVTGSVNQWGDVQAIGGVNEKIEGFFDLCRERGLTGTQGVLIPQANVRNLMLRPDIVEAIGAGQFHVYPVMRIDQGLELLTGTPAGDIATSGTVHYLVNEHLRKLAEDIVAFSDGSRDGAQPGETPASETPA